jgi:ABC-type antimicrobial peptide transport system permease subunit
MVMIDTEDRPTSLWRDAWRRLRRNRLAVAGLAIIVALVAVAALGSKPNQAIDLILSV